ncbi:MAG: hypothetical protein HY680_01370 [Chloroflexi bacterium]|nr:hypothetical protein [Chloroflexota bacterium]
MTKEWPDEGERYLSTTFAVSPEKLESQGRALNLLLLHRRCSACWGTLIQDEAGGREIPWEEHLAMVEGHCSRTAEFIYPGLPLMEAVFRVLLGRGNAPTTLGEIHGVLQEKWADSSSHWAPPPARLYRMASRDVFYGIIELASGKA